MRLLLVLALAFTFVSLQGCGEKSASDQLKADAKQAEKELGSMFE